MTRLLTCLTLAAATAFGTVATATAATLSFDGTLHDVAQALPDNFDPRPIDGQMFSDHDAWRRATSDNTKQDIIAATTDGKSIADGTGVALTAGASQVTVTYIGSEAAAHNRILVNGNELFDNRSSTFGQQKTAIWDGGALDFAFCTETDGKPERSGCVNNTSGVSGERGDILTVAFSHVFAFNGKDTVLIFFGDGLGDSDLDDMVLALSVEPLTSVPLPAGLLLLGSAALGLGAVGRRRSRA